MLLKIVLVVVLLIVAAFGALYLQVFVIGKKRKQLVFDEEYEKVMKEIPKYWWEFPTYKKRFELLRPVFYLLAKANLVPMSFYLKYCFPVKNN